MNMLMTPRQITPEDLLLMPEGRGFELVDGQLLEQKVSVQSSFIGACLICLLGYHCKANNLGWVFNAENGYQCFPGSPNQVRKPDVSFIQTSRLNADLLAQGFSRIPPDLAGEVTSPNDLVHEIEQKIELYFRAGVRLVWVVVPETRTVRVCRPNGSDTRLHETDTLTGEDIVPGFQCLVRDLFPPPLPSGTAS